MKEHAITFEMVAQKEELYCYLQIKGDLTHEDYEFFVPEFERAIQNLKNPHIKLLVDASFLRSWDIHAVWDDVKFGLKHGNKFSKIAVVAHSTFYEKAVTITNWFMPCEMQYFENLNDAQSWLFQ